MVKRERGDFKSSYDFERYFHENYYKNEKLEKGFVKDKPKTKGFSKDRGGYSR